MLKKYSKYNTYLIENGSEGSPESLKDIYDIEGVYNLCVCFELGFIIIF